VISIAHRLNFIRNSDKILVLNTGGTISTRRVCHQVPISTERA
jgi:ABC-type bacteriocin/lantibiotic exporter with double-glycine peptidase domain